MHVHIALPAYGGQVHAGFANSLLELTHTLQRHRVGFTLAWQTGESHVGRARNTALSDYILTAGCGDVRSSVFQFIDTDLVFSASTVADHLLACLEGEAPVGLVGGSYPTKRLHHNDIQQALAAGYPLEEALLRGQRQTLRLGGRDRPGGVVDPDTLVETLYTPRFTWAKCLWLPTGLLTIPRVVALQLAEAYKDRMYVTDGGQERWDLFPTLIEEVGGQRILLSEDYAFCELAAKAGVESWANMNLAAQHIGSYTYGVAT